MSFQSSVGSNGEETPLKKKVSLQLLPQTTTISSLPDDLILSCLARVSRLYYPTLSLVSKKFRRLLASPNLYKVRSLLRRAEFCLHVCLRFNGLEFSDPDHRWFILCRKPNGKKKKKMKSGGYALATIPISHTPRRAYSEVLVAVGSNIYAIGGSNPKWNAPPSSSVLILDCRSHTWREAPSMRVERNFGNANVCDGKIYVAGGCQDKNDSSKWMEVYDPKIQTWETVFCPVAERCTDGRYIMSAVIEGEIFMFGNHTGLAYKPKEDRWTSLGGSSFMDIERELPWLEGSSSYCVIDNILYCYSRKQDRGLVWYDSNSGYWKDVTGLRGLPKIPNYSCLRLVCYGQRRMVVLWDKNVRSSGGNYKTIWCAVIELYCSNKNVKWGNVESLDEDVLTVPSSYKFVCALTATLW